MANLRNFVNAITNDNRLYTAEDIGNMTSKEFVSNEKAIGYQMENLGIPRQSDLTNNSDVVYVKAYTREDGTKVKAHYRSKQDGVVSVDVLSAKVRGNYVDIELLDTYDFNKNEKNPLVKMGRSAQETGKLNPYFTIVKCRYKLK